jgi:hypothetical protein
MVVSYARIFDLEPGAIVAILGLLVYFFRMVYDVTVAHRDDDGEPSVDLRRDQVIRLMENAPVVLEDHSAFYRKLSTKGKSKFLKRLQYVLATKRFIGKDGFKLTAESELVTAAAFVQVGYGHHVSLLDRFELIAIYPDVFYSVFLKRDLKGSTSTKGVIRFSWKHLDHGFSVPDDNINLALHELAHAIKIVIKEREGKGKGLINELAAFNAVGEPVRDAILMGKLDEIRTYAATNEHEFFACCVEYFFENPDAFKESLPEVYFRLVAILNIDPTRSDFDCQPDKEEMRYGHHQKTVVRKHVVDHFKEPGDWYQWMIVLGLIVGWFITFFLLSGLESSIMTRGLFLLTVVTVGVLLFYRRFLVSGFMTTGTFLTFLLCGWTPVISTAAILVNNAVPIYTHTYRVPVERVTNDRGEYYAFNENSEIRSVRDGVEIDREVYWMVRKDSMKVELDVELYYGLFVLECLGEVRSIPIEQ